MIVGLIGYNGWAMKRSLQKDTELSVCTQAEFLNFTIYLFYWKSSNLKIWRLSKNAKPLC